jgi:hypothetical protein
VAYGSAGFLNARAIETLHGVVIELQMAPIRREHCDGAVSRDRPGRRSLNDSDHQSGAKPRAKLDHLVWRGEALKAGRERTLAGSSRAA